MTYPGQHGWRGEISIFCAFLTLASLPTDGFGITDPVFPFEHLGPHDGVSVLGLDQGTRPQSYYNHDNSFEDALCCRLQACVPPYGGAFAEAFSPPLSVTHICEIILWVTETGFWTPQPVDLYIWEGGLTEGPGSVVHVETGLVMSNVPTWPTIGENSFTINIPVPPGPFAAGYWADFSQDFCAWYVACDRDGSGGQPWVNIPPGLGYPSGWQHPVVVWQNPLNALGIGVSYIDLSGGVMEEPYWDPPPADPRWTWGRIKALFH